MTHLEGLGSATIHTGNSLTWDSTRLIHSRIWMATPSQNTRRFCLATKYASSVLLLPPHGPLVPSSVLWKAAVIVFILQVICRLHSLLRLSFSSSYPWRSGDLIPTARNGTERTAHPTHAATAIISWTFQTGFRCHS